MAADSIFFGRNPTVTATEKLRASISPATTQPKSVDQIAQQTGVAANFLHALGEAAGAKDEAELVQIASAAAAEIAPRIQAGEKVEDVFRSLIPDAKQADAFITRAYDIADELYPAQAAPAPDGKTEGGMVAALGAGVDQVQQGFGSAVEGLGRVTGMEGVAAYGADVAARNAEEAAANSAGLTQWNEVDGLGSAAKFAGEVAAQNAPQMGLSIGAGVAGAAAGAAIGSAIPIIGTAAGAVIGGIAGGMGINIPLFYGQNRERQKEAIAEGYMQEMDEGAAFLAALPQAAMDTLVDRFLVGKFLKPDVLNAGGILTRVVKNAATGVATEVPTEIGQQIIERAQAGLPLSDDEAINEYIGAGVAAGILGGGVGGAAGALSGDSRNAPAKPAGGPLRQAMNDAAANAPVPNQTPAGAAPQRDPVAPTGGMPTVTHSTVVEDGRYGGRNQRTIARLSNGDTLEINGTLDDPQVNAAFEAELQARYGQPTPPPAPMREAADNAPAPLFNGLQAGAPVTVTVQGGNSFQAVFDGETAMDITVIDEDGAYREIPRAEIEAGRVTIGAGLDPVIEEGTAPKAPPAPLVQEITPPPARPNMSAPAAEALDYFEERAALIQADGATREEANARAAQLTLDYIARMGVNDDADLNELASAFASQIGDGAPAAQPAQASAPDRIMGKDNTPFPTEKRAQEALGKLGDQAAQYRIEAVENGFALIKRPQAQEAAGVRPDGMAGIGQAGTLTGDQPAGGQRDPGNALEGQGTGGVAGTGVVEGLAGATGVTEQGGSLTPEPAGVADVAGVAQDDDAAAWDVMNQDERADAVKRVGYVTKKGNVDRPGLKLAASPWASLPDAAKDKLRPVLRAPAPAQAEPAQIEAAQTPAPQDAPAPQPEAQTQPEAPAPQAETQAEAPAAPETAPEPMPEPPAAPQDEGTDPLRAAIRAGMAAGVVEHTTKKGKTLRGYIVPLNGGFKGKEIEAVDEYSFRKDGGMFVRAEKAEAFMGEAAPAPQAPAPQTDTPDAPPVTDDRKEARLRQAREIGRQAALDNEPRTAPDWMEGEIADAWLEGYGAGIAERAQVSETEGPFGPILTGYEGDWKGAALELERRQTGEAPGALSHPDVGPIALVWGKEGSGRSDGYGLSKLIAWHPEVLNDLQGRLEKAEVVSRSENRIRLQSKSDDFAVRLDWDGANGAWLLSAFERGNRRDQRSTIRLEDLLNGSSPLQPTPQSENSRSDAQNQPAPQTEARPEDAPATEAEGQTDTAAQQEPAQEPAAKPAGGILSVLSEDKQKRAEELKARLAAKARNQLSSGVDPEYLTLGGELVALYIEAGTKRFAQMLRDFAESTGLTMRQAQAPMRVAYNHVRDEMDLNGEDVSEFDTADQVMAEIRKAIAEEADAPQNAPVEPEEDPAAPADMEAPQEEATDGPASNDPANDQGDLGGPERQRPADTEGSLSGGRPVEQGGGSGDEDAPRDGDNVAGGLVGGQPGDTGGAATERRGENPGNFVITPDFPLGEGTDGQKIKNNIAAIRLVKQLEAENRYATKDEQAVLARYVGWGGLKTVFDPRKTDVNDQYGRAQAELKEILTTAEYRAAGRSTADAHYTSRTVVNAMWAAMRRFGFEGGRAMEPTIGTGNFVGLMPAELSDKTEWFAAELDKVTGLMAKHLYPDATVFDGMGFQNAPFRNGTIDVAIGNPPFGSSVISSDLYPEIPPMSVHNYIIAKTGMHLREGGIMGMVVTSRFLDTANLQARAYLARHFNFLGAVRLPNTAFKANAGTEVTTDIVWFQKRREGEPSGDLSWLDTGVPLDLGGTVANGYFARNPDMMLGRPGMDGTMYGGGQEFTLHDDGRDLPAALDEALRKIEARLPTRTEALEAAVVQGPATSDLAINEAALLDDGRIVMRRDDDADGNAVVEDVTAQTLWGDAAMPIQAAIQAVEAARDAIKGGTRDEQAVAIQRARAALVATTSVNDAGALKKSVPAGLGKQAHTAIGEIAEELFADNPYFGRKAAAALKSLNEALNAKRIGPKKLAVLRGLLSLRKNTKALLAAENADDPNIERMRADLRKEYSAFVKAHGYVNNPSNEAVLNGVPGIEAALESRYKPANKARGIAESAEMATILRKRVIVPHKAVDKADSAADGVHISLRERGRLDIDYIARLTGFTPERVRKDLTTGDNPLAFFDPVRDEYVLADEYLSGNLAEKIEQAKRAGLPQNERSLRDALPPPKTAEQITPAMRSLWIPPSIYEDFLIALGAYSPKVRIDAKLGTMSIDASGVPSEFGAQFRTERKTPFEIFEAAAKGKTIVIYDKIDEKQVKNEAETRNAAAAMERMQREFEKWAYLNPERKAEIVDAFNKKMNVVVERKFDGVKYLTMVGNNPEIQLRNSQKNGAWRMILSPSALLHHVVGAGKTFTAITAIMERKRLGLSRKTLVAVPNHLVTQWAKDFYALYPGANILAATEADFKANRRRKLLARIATGEFDAVIIGHSNLKFIKNNEDDVRAIMEEQISDLEESLNEARRNKESGRTVKQIQERIEKYQARLAATLDALRADNLGFDFAQMGVDNLVIDEAHEFKNLEYSTAAQRLVGMNAPDGSQRALDLYIKTRGMFKRDGAVGFLTGTPVSNSLVEIYTVMKYLAPKTLRDMNLMHFDAWSAAFIQAQDRFEYTPAMKLKERRVMSGLVNLGPLSDIYRSFADIVMRPEVEAMYREQMEEQNRRDGTTLSTRFPTPKVKGGGRQLITIPSSADHEEFTDYLVMRSEGIKRRASDKEYPKKDNMLWVLSDARKASIDIRAVDPQAKRQEDSKVVRSGTQILRIARAWEADRGTQMVFADSSVPLKAAKASIQKAIREAWEKAGVKDKADVKRRMESAQQAGKTYQQQVGEIIDMVEERIAAGQLAPAQRDAAEEWLNGDAQEMLAVAQVADTGFSFYDDLKAYLVENGMKPEEVAFIHDYDTADKKAALFEDVNAGRVRVLIGSTFKMGAGTNAQERLVGLHHIDAPWRPSDMEQREGRIIRQGNALYARDPDGFEVEIIAYATEKTSDVVLWQVLERKAAGIEQFLNATADTLIEDNASDADSYAQFMAQSTGNPVFLKKMEAEKAVQDLEAEQSSQRLLIEEARRFVAAAPNVIRTQQGYIEASKSLSFADYPQAGKTWDDYQRAVRAYEDAKRAHEEEANRVRKENADLPAGTPKKILPKFETPAPSIFPEGKAADSYYKEIASRLDDLQKGQNLAGQNNGIREAKPIKVGDVELVLNGALTSQGMDFYVQVRFGGNGWSLMGYGNNVSAKNPLNSRALIRALHPDAIAARLTEIREGAEQRIKNTEAALPEMERKAAAPIDTARLDRLRREAAGYVGQVRLAEVKAQESRVGRANRFAAMDIKERDLQSSRGDDAPVTNSDGSGFVLPLGGKTYRAPYGAKGRDLMRNGNRVQEIWVEGVADDGDRTLFLLHQTSTAAEQGRPAETTFAVEDTWDLGRADPEMRGSVAATLTGTELGAYSDVRDLGRKAEAWYRANLVGTTVTNAATGMVIRFNARGAKKTAGRKGEDLYRMVPALREILANGQLIGTEQDRKSRSEVKAVHKVQADVSLEGRIVSVIATVREMQDGTFHYDLSMDNAAPSGAADRVAEARSGQPDDNGGGSEVLRGRGPANPTVELRGSTSALEGGPAILNLEIAPVENKPRMSAERMRAVAERLNAELARTGIDRTVRARLVRGLMDEAGVEIQGRQRGNVLEVNPNAPAGALGVLRHEIVHVLRDAGLWGQPYGLFEQGEWRGLVAEARKRTDIRARVERDYKGRNLTEAQITEEIIAEMYREWAQRRDAAGGLGRVFGKIRGFLRAVANALRGEGFQSAAQTFDRIANGTVGGRGPDGGGGGGRSAEMRRALNAVVPKRLASTFEEARAAVASFQGKPLVNDATGLVATVSRNTLDKMMSRSAVAKSTSAQLHALAVANADALFKQAKLGWTKRDRGGDTGIAGIHRFFAVTEKPDGRMAMVKMTVKETVREVDRNPLYTIEAVDEVDAPSAAMWVASAIDADAIDPKAIRSAEDVMNMARMVDNFNRQPRAPELRMPTMPFARNEAEYDKAERGLISNLLTDAMAGQFGKLGSERMSLLGLVPGRALFAELGKYLPGAQTYLRLKEEMDALRSEWHHITDEVATRWRKALSKDGAGNKAMMDLMHDATRAGVDPSLRFVPPQKKKGELQEDHRARVAKLEEAYADLRPRWNALPDDFKAIYREVRDTYGKLSDAFEKTLIENVKTAMTINVRRAERAYEAEVERIADEGLTGQEKDDALETAKKKLVTAKAKAEWGINARVTKLRLQFETNKIDGPYFPLMRHGTFFVTVRDADGKVVSFSRFENVKKQMSFVKEMQQDPALTVKFGTMEASDMRDQVDPNFVAEVERILGENVSDPKVMDMVWQRWLETLPDFSVRRSRIHRKGTPGFDGDAFRAFGKQVFHGGHQLARLKYSMLMDDALRQARKEAEGSSDPNRNGLIVDEMARRHEFVMDPKGGPIAQFLTSAAFVYYLGITPAAALVNLSQTTVVGIPMLAAGFRQANVGRAARELTRALADFVQGRADATKSPRLSADEKAAMEEAYRRGTIDKSEAHDLAGVAESGVEYSNRRMQVMKPISFLFHHTERMNREITYLAAYRMARSYGMDHADAIQKASDLTWKTHFDYSNTSRPRLVQNDFAKVALVFRNFQLNMLWRLFRDAHQIFKGRSPEERREARTQLLGITAMMFAHAGITGTWTYALLMTLAGLFMGGDSDDAEEELKRAIVETFGPGAGGILLKGIPGQITGVDLTSRMGMPELWFRTSDRQLEGDDEYYYFMEQMVGAVPAIGQNVWRGMQQIGEGNVWRGVETAMPKAIRDLMKGYRYAADGVETYNGDPIIEEISAGDALIQAMGFTPAQVAERYEQNTRLKNFERRILRDLSAILKDATTAIRDGAGIPQAVLDEIREFNVENPTYPITWDTIMRSLKSRMRASQEMEGGIRLNQRLDQPLRLQMAPSINQ